MIIGRNFNKTLNKSILDFSEPVQDRCEPPPVASGRSGETGVYIGVNEDFEHRLTTNGGSAVDLEQILSDRQIQTRFASGLQALNKLALPGIYTNDRTTE